MDFERISHLLHVVEKSAGHPNLKAIHGEAMKELEQHARGDLPRYGAPAEEEE